MRNAAELEAAYTTLVDEYPEYFAPIAKRLGSLGMVRQSMHILIRREQEGDWSVTPILDDFETVWRAAL